MENIILYGKSFKKQSSKKVAGKIYKKDAEKGQKPGLRTWDLAARLEHRRTGSKKNKNSFRANRG